MTDLAHYKEEINAHPEFDDDQNKGQVIPRGYVHWGLTQNVETSLSSMCYLFGYFAVKDKKKKDWSINPVFLLLRCHRLTAKFRK